MHGGYCAAQGRYPGGKTTPMAEPLPEAMARSAARQVYRLLRFSAPLLRPIYRQIGLERRARAVTALVRIGWNGAPVKAPLASELDHRRAERPAARGSPVSAIPARNRAIGEALRATAKGFAAAGVPFTLVGLGGYTTARLEDESMAAHAGTCLDRRVNLFCDGIVGRRGCARLAAARGLCRPHRHSAPLLGAGEGAPALCPAAASLPGDLGAVGIRARGLCGVH